MTDAVKEWYRRKLGGTTCPMGVITGRVADGVYLAFWESTAKQNKSKLGCDHHESRNHLREAQLAILDRAEDRATESSTRLGQYQADQRCGSDQPQTHKSPPLTPAPHPAVSKLPDFLSISQIQNQSNLNR